MPKPEDISARAAKNGNGSAPTSCCATPATPCRQQHGQQRTAAGIAHGPGYKVVPGWRRHWRCVLVPLLGLGVFATFFVGWDVLTRLFLPQLSTAARHALLTGWAALLTGIATTTIYLIVHRQHQRLSDTAERIARLIDACQTNPTNAGRFENSNLVHCRAVLGCDRRECPMYDQPGQRCWQVMALDRAARDGVAPRIELELCLNCEVYRRSCPDKLTELGESFNNLMFLLEAESQRFGRMQGELFEKEKMAAIGQLAAGIAHEVCNPLSSISAVVQVLKREHVNAAVGERLDLIQTHIQRITDIVRKLMRLAHPGVDRWETVDLKATLDEVVRLIAYDRRARNVRIDWTPGEATLELHGVRDQLQQVFINLALNALDAMPEGGELRIRAEKLGPNIVVRLADTGCGVPPELGRRIFDPFFTTKPQGQGTGLGLAVSYGVVQRHRGTMDFESNNGRGTVFTIELPIQATAGDVRS